MNNVENRIVEMKFDNAQFEAAVAKTMQTLDKFKEKLNFEDSGKGLDRLGNSTNNYTGILASVGSALDTLQSKFGSLSSVGERVFSSLTSGAIGFIKNGVNKTVSDIMQGGMSRAMNLEQAKFQLEGILGSAEDVNRVIYSDILPELQGTPFSLDQAAVVMGQLAASGKTTSEDVQQGTRAIAGAAAMTNSSFADMGRIFTKVAGNGRVMGDTLQEMSSRGLNAAADMSNFFNQVNSGHKEVSENVRAMVADITGGAETTEADIRELVTAGKISYDAFAATMDNLYGAQAKKSTTMYTGALEDLRAALARIGAEPMAVKLEFLRDAFNALVPAVDAVNAVFKPFTSATKELEEYVNDEGKTVTRYAKPFAGILSANVQKAGWAFQELFVNLDENKDIIRYSEDNWKKYGLQMEKNKDGTVSYFEVLESGRKVYHDFGEAVMNHSMLRIVTAAAESLVNVVAALGNLLGAVGKGMLAAFPKVTLENIADLVDGFQRFTKALVFSEPVLNSIRFIVQALFTPLGLLARVLVTIAKVIAEVVTMVYRAVRPVIKVLVSSLGIAASLFSGLGKLVDQAGQNVTWFAEKIYGGIKALAKFLHLDVLVGKLRDGLDALSGKFSKAQSAIYKFFTGFSDNMHKFGKYIYDLLRLDEVAAALARLRDRFHLLMQATGHLGFDKIAQAFKDLRAYVSTLFAAFEPIKNIKGSLKSFAENLLMMVPTDKIIDSIGRFANFITKLAIAFTNFAAPYIQKASDFIHDLGINIGKLLASAKNSGALNTLVQLVTTLFSRLSSYIPQLMGFKSFGDMLDGIRGKISGFVDVFKDFIQTIIGGGKAKASDFGKNIHDSLGGIGDSKMIKKIKSFSDVVKQLGEILKGFSSKIGEKLKDFYKALEAGDKKKIIATLSMLVMALSYVRAIAKAKKTIDAAANVIKVFGGIGDLLTGVGKAFTGAAKTVKRITVLIGITTSLLIFAAAMSLLSRMDMDGLIQGGIAAIGALIALSIAMAILNKIAVDDANGKKLMQMGAAMAAIGAAVLMISTSMEKIAGVYDSHTPKQFLAIVGTLAGMMGAFALLAFEFSKLDKMEANLKSAGLSMIAIATAIKMMTKAIETIGQMDTGSVVKGGLVVAGLIAFMGALAYFTANNQNFGAVGSSILKIAFGLLILAGAIAIYARMDPIKLAFGIAKLGLSLIALMAIFTIFSNAVGPQNAGGLIVVAIAVIAFAAALTVLSVIPFTALIQGIAGLVIVIAAIAITMAAFSALGAGMLVVGGALLLLGVAFLAAGAGAFLLTMALSALVPLFLLLSTVDMDMINDGLNVIKTIADGLSSAFKSLALGILAFGAALLVAAVAVLVLASGVVLLGAGFLICGVGLLALAGGLATIGLVIDAFFGGELLSKIGSAFETFGSTVINGLSGLVDKAKKFFSKEKGQSTVQDYIDGGKEAIEQDTGMSDAFGNKANEAVDAFGNVKGDFTDTISRLMTDGGQSITDNSAEITDPLSALGFDMNSITDKNVTNATDLFGKLPGKAGSALDANGKSVTNAVKRVFNKDNIPTRELETASKETATKQVRAHATALASKVGEIKQAAASTYGASKQPFSGSYSDFYGYGSDAGQGYKQGLSSWIRKAADAAASIVTAAKEAAKNAQDSNSPSKDFAKLGRWADEGYIIGLQSLAGKVAKTAAGVVDGGVMAVTDAMSVIADATALDMDFTPTITPVVDLTEVRQGVDSMNGLFQKSYGLNTPYSGLLNAGLAASAFQNRSNNSAFDAIDSLAKEIGQMNDTMNSRQMVNNIQIDGSEDPDAFADALTRRFKMNVRTM